MSRRRAGMTLVEVLLAFAILIAGLVSVFAMFNGGFRTHKRAVNETDATLIATSLIAETRAELGIGRQPSSDPANVFTKYAPNPIYEYNRNVQLLQREREGMLPGAAGLEYLIRVEVRWSDRGDNKSIRVETIGFLNRFH